MRLTIRLLIAEDQQLIRQGLAALLIDTDIIIEAEASDGESAVNLALKWRPDLVLMDLAMPGIDGVEATRRIKRAMPQIKILILSGASFENRVAEAFSAGADGYALKKLGQDELKSAIRAVACGKRYLGPGIDPELVREYIEAELTVGIKLTDRERQVLELIAKGFKNREISGTLNIAVKTVETHRTKLATYAIRRGMIE
jgi:two-component system, NarL family, response regulator NreC